MPVNPGGTITYTADYGAPGNAPLTHYTGTGSFKFAAPAAMRDALRGG